MFCLSAFQLCVVVNSKETIWHKSLMYFISFDPVVEVRINLLVQFKVMRNTFQQIYTYTSVQISNKI